MEKASDSRKKALGWLTAAFAALLLSSGPVRQLSALPDLIRISEGATARIELGWPMTAAVRQDEPVLSSLSETLSDATQVSLTAEREGEASVTFRLLGILPLRTVDVSVDGARTVAPGGQSVGIALATQGVVVVGLSDPGGSIPGPARLAGVKPGDVISAVDGAPLENAEALTRRVADGAPLSLTLRRGGQVSTIDVTPTADAGGAYRLGLWVRDSTAGIGTMTFYDPETSGYGALGHAVTDPDTGITLPVRRGDLMESAVTAIEPGKKGEPGELVGHFTPESRVLGSILANTPLGIYGELSEPLTNELFPGGVPVMSSGEVRPGPAQLLTTLDDGGVRAYDCEIVKLTGSTNAERSFVLRVTDPELLRRTGGIVQGMSGSPVLQEGRLAGAVTHVFVSDPTRGYGVFIENMIETMEETVEEAALERRN
ncbi:MAG: SpoIVB peptidase [Clostridia bacterium]|nr:SpoIVB peptidase [Clostridia bacterium]